MFNFGTKMTRR